MVITKKSIPRRTFLRGAGAALALPVLDAMTPALAAEATRPIRMAFMQVPNGIMNLNNEWTPKTEGADFEMTRILEPLADFQRPHGGDVAGSISSRPRASTSKSAAIIRAPAPPG